MSLLSCRGLKSPSDTTAAETTAAKAARADHEQKQIDKFEGRRVAKRLARG